MYSALGMSAGYGLSMTGSGVRLRVLWLDDCGWERVEAGKEERGGWRGEWGWGWWRLGSWGWLEGERRVWVERMKEGIFLVFAGDESLGEGGRWGGWWRWEIGLR